MRNPTGMSLSPPATGTVPQSSVNLDLYDLNTAQALWSLFCTATIQLLNVLKPAVYYKLQVHHAVTE